MKRKLSVSFKAVALCQVNLNEIVSIQLDYTTVTESIYIKVNVCMYVCVCMFQHNYLLVNGIVSFPSFT
jgi:hypothetical protein